MSVLAGKRVVLGITGGISAYKGAELCRLLKKAGADVRVMMTRAAAEFITPLTLQTLSGHPVSRDLFDLGEESQIGHIRLADETDLVVIAPATADVIARLAGGLADDLVTAVVLATRAPVVLAPAMNVNMWENPLTQGNLRRLLASGQITTVGPDAGALACGWIGAGRLMEPTEIVAALETKVGSCGPTLAGRRVLVTAGPTHEAVDDVRYLGNRSSGKMGFALARAAAERGALVTLLAGPVALATPPGVVARVDVESALQMQQALQAALPTSDVLVMAAAVADFRPAERVRGKLSRRGATATASTLALVPNPDLLAEIGRGRTGAVPFLVGFAAQLQPDPARLLAEAQQKLRDKACDLVVANDVSDPALGFGSEHNAVTLVFRDGTVRVVDRQTKDRIAVAIWEEIASRLPSPCAVKEGTSS